MEQLKPLVNTHDVHEAFLAYIRAKIETARKGLEQADDIKDVGRYQGEIRAYRRLLNIRDEVNFHDRQAG